MLEISKPLKSASSSGDYYTETEDNYYIVESDNGKKIVLDQVATWHGKLTKEFELPKYIETSTFKKLLDGKIGDIKVGAQIERRCG